MTDYFKYVGLNGSVEQCDKSDPYVEFAHVADYQALAAQNAELVALVEALSMDDEAIEGLTAWLSEFEQSIDVGCGNVESSAATLIKHLTKLKQAPAQHLRDIQSAAIEHVVTDCQLIVARATTTYRENPGMGFSSTIEDKTAKQLKQELTKDFAQYAERVKQGSL